MEEQKKPWISTEKIIQNLPFLLFLIGLTLIYIANAHYHIKLERKIDRSAREIKNIRWEYMSTKNELMYKSKQSEVADLAANQGLEVLTQPPKKIVVPAESSNSVK